jgi:hypothetical protein
MRGNCTINTCGEHFIMKLNFNNENMKRRLLIIAIALHEYSKTSA